MNTLFENIIKQLQSSDSIDIKKYAEDLYEVVILLIIKNPVLSLPVDISLKELQNNDALEMSFYEDIDEDEIKTVYDSNKNNWQDISSAYNDISKEEGLKVKIRVAKGSHDNIRSVYDKSIFLQYLCAQPFDSLLDIFSKLLVISDNFIFSFSEKIDAVLTQRFAFVQSGTTPTFHKAVDKRINEKAKKFCCSDIIRDSLTSSDFYSIGNNGDIELQEFLDKLSILYGACYIFDYNFINDGIWTYRLNGFKTLTGELNIKEIKKVKFSRKDVQAYNDIITWIYNGGNASDKIMIARNIISLNLKNDDLGLCENTFDAILSNYRIFEKENVSQYISVRNDISKQLRDYQKDVVKIVDDFESDFYKFIFSFLTFTFTTVLIRVIAKNAENETIIPDEVIFMLMAYCGISLVYYCFARWSLNKKLEMFDKQYEKARANYKDILSSGELDELFADVSKKDGTKQAFQKERSTNYTIVWVISVAIIFISLLFLLYYNHHDILNGILTKVSELCATYSNEACGCQGCCK